MKYVRFRPNPYALIAFTTGFGLLTYELIASRLLAPTVGSSIYVWTSVIGVIIAALSLGYAIGGKQADKRVEPLDVAWLLLISAGTVTITSLSASDTLQNVVSLTKDPRLQGFLASLLLFGPTSLVLGIISPYLARLKNVSVKTTGSTIASLSSLNAIGSIAGTFCTGFIFLAYLGSKQTLLFVSWLLLASSWVILPKAQIRYRFVGSLLVVAFGLLSLVNVSQKNLVAQIDTPTASYEILDITYKNTPTRVLVTGPGGYQSGIYTDGNQGLAFGYTRAMADVVDRVSKKERILILGGGAYTMPEYLATTYPSSRIDVVELDPELENIARQYFNYKAPDNVHTIAQDARAYLNNNRVQYDVILIDVFSDSIIPFSLTTREFAEKLRTSLASDGVVAMNIHGSKSSKCINLLTGMQQSLAGPFTNAKLLPVENPNVQIYQNFILAFSDADLGYLPSTWNNAGQTDTKLLTDNFAPTEHLKAQCIKS